MSIKFYRLKPEYSFTKGSFFFVVYPDGRLDLNFGQYENQVNAIGAELAGHKFGLPRQIYVKDLINAFEPGRAVERGEAKEWIEESEEF